MADGNGQTDLQRDPFSLDPERPESWGEEASTVSSRWPVDEFPVRLVVLVSDKSFVGFRGPKRVLDAIQEAYLHEIDIDGLYDEACRCPRTQQEGSQA